MHHASTSSQHPAPKKKKTPLHQSQEQRISVRSLPWMENLGTSLLASPLFMISHAVPSSPIYAAQNAHWDPRLSASTSQPLRWGLCFSPSSPPHSNGHFYLLVSEKILFRGLTGTQAMAWAFLMALQSKTVNLGVCTGVTTIITLIPAQILVPRACFLPSQG